MPVAATRVPMGHAPARAASATPTHHSPHSAQTGLRGQVDDCVHPGPCGYLQGICGNHATVNTHEMQRGCRLPSEPSVARHDTRGSV
eukprot:6148585-Prymnesium_polylepis.1